jgi:hypothetical protein
MDVAAKARANAISLELKKDGLQQRQSGDWQLRFTVAAIDMDQRLTAAAMGTRYQCVLVEISDNEEPVDHVAIERDKWRGLGPTKQSGIRCSDPVFWAWLEEEGYPRGERYPCDNNDKCAMIVRMLCDVASRADFNKPGFVEQRIKWHAIDDAFRAWKAKEHA